MQDVNEYHVPFKSIVWVDNYGVLSPVLFLDVSGVSLHVF